MHITTPKPKPEVVPTEFKKTESDKAIVVEAKDSSYSETTRPEPTRASFFALGRGGIFGRRTVRN